MNYQILSDNDWLYPDSQITSEGCSANVCLPRNASDCFQILTDEYVDENEAIDIRFACDAQVEATVYQLLPVNVEANSAATFCTTMDYESVKDFVERQAPYEVYDVTRPIDDGRMKKGRAAFYVRIRSKASTAPGQYVGKLTLAFKDKTIDLKVDINVHKCCVPELKDARFGMVNWLYTEPVRVHHQAEPDSERFWKIFAKYVDNQLEMRNTHLQLPSGVPVRDGEGRIVDFDFTLARKVGDLALAKGFNYIYGGFVARFKEWDKPGQFLLWNREVEVGTMEGYRQLSIYFTKQKQMVEDAGWGDRFMQGLVDEPQFANSADYRILSNIFRGIMPGVTIIDPVESTELYGSLEVWIVKQELYEKYADTYETIRKMGAELWVYTCGFPANDWMNRILDLHPLAGRLPMWMAIQYNMKGFLHWGYNCFSERPFENTCVTHRFGNLPAGDANIVYPGNDQPWDSVRSHLQRAGAEEAELLMQLMEKDEEKAREIIGQVCTTFKVYTKSSSEFAKARRSLLKALDAYC